MWSFKNYIESHKLEIDKGIYMIKEHVLPYLVTLFSGAYSWSKGILLNKMVIFEDISVIISTCTAGVGLLYMLLRLVKFIYDWNVEHKKNNKDGNG